MSSNQPFPATSQAWQPQQTTVGGSFAPPSARAAKTTPSGPPWYLLLVAIALAIVGVVLDLVLTASLTTRLIGWLLCVAAFGAITAYMVIDVKRRGRAGYAVTSLSSILFPASIGLCLAATACVSVFLGLYVGRM